MFNCIGLKQLRLEGSNLKIIIKSMVKDQRQRRAHVLACGGSSYALVAYTTSSSNEPSSSLVSLDMSQQTHFDDVACVGIAGAWQ